MSKKKKNSNSGESRVSSLSDQLAQAASEWSPDSANGAESSGDTPSESQSQAESRSHGNPTDEAAQLSPSAEPASAPQAKSQAGNEYVTFIDEPFGIRTPEISQAQQSSEELELDEDLEGTDLGDSSETAHSEDAELEPETPLASAAETDAQLENIARTIGEQEKELEAQARAANEITEEQSQAELAQQIAEDQALQAELAREALEAEKALETDPELLAALPKEPVPDENGNYDLSELQSCIETLLFMVDKPTSTKKLKEWLGPDFKEEIFEEALKQLQARYQGLSHGIELVEVANGWQLRTKPVRAALAKKLAKIQTQRLSTGGMESLAIVAYRQPVMKEEIDKIRGVDSSYFIRGLLDKKLIAISGRSELPGRPMLYSTTEHFLELFGLKDLSAMPSLRELEQMVPASQSKNPDDPASEDPRIREMRRLVDKMKSDTSTNLLYDPKEDEAILTEIRERVKSIPTSTPYLDEQKALEKAAKEGLTAADAKPPENLFEAADQASLAEQFIADTAAAAAGDGTAITPEMADVPPSEALDEPEPTTDQA